MKKFLVNIIPTLLIVSVLNTLPTMAESTTTIVEAQVGFRAQNIKVDSNDGVNDVPLMTFTVKSEGGPTVITGFYVTTRNLSAVPTTLRIYSNQAWGPIGTSSSPTIATTINSNVIIDDSTATTFTLSGDFSSNTSGWCIGRVIGIKLQNQDGTSKDVFMPGEIYGPERRFFGGVANWIVANEPTISTTTDQNGFTTSMTATFTLQVTTDGMNLAQPTGKDFVVVASCNPNNEVICNSVSAIVIPNGPIADGATHTVTVSATITAADIRENGLYRFSIRQINWGTNSSSQVQQYWGIGNFKTWAGGNYYRPETPPARPIATPTISAELYQAIDSFSQANDFGPAGQVVGEGGFIRITPHDISEYRSIVFPYPTSEHKGQVMRVSAVMNATDMVPIITAPANLLGMPYGSFDQYPISNVINTTSDGVTTKSTFDVNLGTITCHGKLVRTGDGSCLASFYWGQGSTSDLPGNKVDLVNLSPSLPHAERGVLTGLPPRFQFKCKEIRSSGPDYLVLNIISFPYSFKLEGSNDLVNWHEVVGWGYGYAITPLDNVGSTEGWVNISKSTLSTQTLNPNRCFFRIVMLD